MTDSERELESISISKAVEELTDGAFASSSPAKDAAECQVTSSESFSQDDWFDLPFALLDARKAALWAGVSVSDAVAMMGVMQMNRIHHDLLNIRTKMEDM